MEKEVNVRFTDVAGVDEAKDELREVIEFLKTPAQVRAAWARKLPKGVLLVGPPGTGKTLLARAVAGEAGVPFFSISGSDFVEMFVGVGAARVRDLFEQAKQKAPCIIFIDELDALGKARGVGPGRRHDEREQTLNQLLVEMDGFDPRSRRDPDGGDQPARDPRPGAAAGRPLRPPRAGRSPRQDRPPRDPEGARASKVTLDSGGRPGGHRRHDAGLRRRRPGQPRQRGGAAGACGADSDKVGLAELQEAVERVVAGLEKKNRVLQPEREEARRATTSSGTRWSRLALPGTDQVQKISIIPRGIAALGYTLQVPTEDRFLMTRERAGEQDRGAARRPRRRGADLRRGLDRRARRSRPRRPTSRAAWSRPTA